MGHADSPARRRFEGRVAIVTGASRGIGLACAERLVADGAKVVITARKEEALAEAAASLGEGNAAWVAGHADDEEHQDETIAKALDEFGRLDMLVNNTGINPVYGRMIDVELGAAEKIMRVNVISAVAWAQKAYHAALKESGGGIVNIASIGGLKPAPNLGMYGTSKAALIHVTEELALELGPDIRVNAVAPGPTDTEATRIQAGDAAKELVKSLALKRLGQPEDMLGAVKFLLSDDAAWVTGQVLAVDGGQTFRL